jgi:hypothetical protein
MRPGRDAVPSPPSSAEVWKQSRAIPLLSIRVFVAYKKGKTYLPYLYLQPSSWRRNVGCVTCRTHQNLKYWFRKGAFVGWKSIRTMPLSYYAFLFQISLSGNKTEDSAFTEVEWNQRTPLWLRYILQCLSVCNFGIHIQQSLIVTYCLH